MSGIEVKIMRRTTSLLCLSIAFISVISSSLFAQETGKNLIIEDGEMMIDTGKTMMENGSRMVDNGNMMIKEEHAVAGPLPYEQYPTPCALYDIVRYIADEKFDHARPSQRSHDDKVGLLLLLRL